MRAFALLMVLAGGAWSALTGPPDDPAEQKQLGDAARARRDFARAEEYYRRAAESGNLDAAVALADVLMRDVPVQDAAGKTTTRKADANAAVQWYLHAFGQGRDDVYFQLGQCYENGWGVKRDVIDAYKWYLLALPKQPAAKPRLEHLTRTMTPGRVQEARRRAEALRTTAP